MERTIAPLPRQHRRTPVGIDVVVTGVLDRFTGRIADLSEGGALVTGGTLPARSRCAIHYGGQILYATVMWAEPERIGLRFPFELVDGPLHQRLLIARGHQRAPLPAAPRGAASFGRRGL